MLELMLPIKTVSEANKTNEHWSKKHKRHKHQKALIYYHLKSRQTIISLPCHITLTRIAPRKLDDADNLPSAFKWIKDAICDYITPGLQAGRADDNPNIHFSFDQKKGKPKEYSILIQIIKS